MPLGAAAESPHDQPLAWRCRSTASARPSFWSAHRAAWAMVKETSLGVAGSTGGVGRRGGVVSGGVFIGGVTDGGGRGGGGAGSCGLLVLSGFLLNLYMRKMIGQQSAATKKATALQKALCPSRSSEVVIVVVVVVDLLNGQSSMTHSRESSVWFACTMQFPFVCDTFNANASRRFSSDLPARNLFCMYSCSSIHVCTSKDPSTRCAAIPSLSFTMVKLEETSDGCTFAISATLSTMASRTPESFTRASASKAVK